MSKFDKAQFHNDGPYLTYGADRKFVARFKHTPRDRTDFVAFLVKHLTVEEYFAAYDAGQLPAQILEAKGYISATVRKVLERSGYPATREGREAYLDEQARRIQQRVGTPGLIGESSWK